MRDKALGRMRDEALGRMRDEALGRMRDEALGRMRDKALILRSGYGAGKRGACGRCSPTTLALRSDIRKLAGPSKSGISR
jgi:hypothetical protein